MYGVPFAGRPPYPLANFDLANCVAVLGAQEGWCAPYVRASYRRWFVDRQEAGAEPNLSDSLKEIGEEPSRVMGLAQTDETGRAYAAATDEARRLAICGAPSFVARGELFWGNDRLEDAVRWQQAGTPRSIFVERQSDIVLRERRRRGLRARHVVELVELAAHVEVILAVETVQHHRHPVGEALRLPDALEAGGAVGGEQVAAAFAGK